MNKKFMAIFIAVLMLVGMIPALSSIPPVKAQEAIPCDPAIASNHPFCVFLNPGVADSSKPGWSHTLDTLWGTQDGASQSLQVFDKYLDYAVLSNSTGDLQFTIIVNDEIGDIRMYVPPEFVFQAPTLYESVWNDITNDQAFLQFSQRFAYDSYAPGFTRIDLGFDQWSSNSVTIEPGTYHIRLFDLMAPSAAGLYFVKFRWYDVNGASSHDLGAGNYPIIVVKSELNPAWIEAIVRTNLGFTPPFVSGRVTAEGTTPEGRAVSAVGYFGPNEWLGDSSVPGEMGAQYHTYLFGVAEGTYTLKAEASGFGPTTTDRFTVSAGQSYHVGPIVLFDTPKVHVTVWSKHGSGELPWNNLWQLPFGTNNPAAAPNDTGPRRDILLELYANSTLVAFWGSDTFGQKSLPATTLLQGLVIGGVTHDDSYGPGGIIPSSTQYNTWLTDNLDVEGNPRGYSSTVWDGHVPWGIADYVSGIGNGQYTVEAFVTGYIMDASDAAQRTITVSGTKYSLQLDLRRTNWIEVAMHLPANVALSAESTVTLTATDTGGNQRGAVAFFAMPHMFDDGVIDGQDAAYADMSATPNWQSYSGGIVIEGWNSVFYDGGARGDFRDISRKDYGLNPTASSHSAGAVTMAGNPYTIKLYMADMGVPYLGIVGQGWYSILGGNPQVSVFLCNSPELLSFSIAPARLYITLRSIDFEVPSHARPWTFPGAYVYVDFVNSTGTITSTLDPTIYGLIQDAGRTDTTTGSMPSGFDIPGAPGGVNAAGVNVGYGVSPYDIDNEHPAGQHSHIGVWYVGTDVCSPTWGGNWGMPFALAPGWYSTGVGGLNGQNAGEYTFRAHTLGYLPRNYSTKGAYPLQVPLTGSADIEADLIQGGHIRVTFKFQNEAVTTAFGSPSDTGFARVEVFNSTGGLVGASIYGQANPNIYSSYLRYNPITDHMKALGPAEGADFGLPTSSFPSSDDGTSPIDGHVYSTGQRANYIGFYNVPDARWPCTTSACTTTGYGGPGWSQMQPSDANSLVMGPGDAQSFDVYGFHWYYGDKTRTWAGGWPTNPGFLYEGFDRDTGLAGSSDIPGLTGSGAGLYTVKVWAFDYGTKRMYEMAYPLENVEVPWGGSVELFVTMNSMATLTGSVSWLDMFGNYRALPWAQISSSPAPSDGTAAYGTPDYYMWLPAGTYDMSVSTSSAPQLWSSNPPTDNAQYTVVVSDGWVGGGDTRLAHQEGVPVPELPVYVVPFGLLAVLGASVWLLRKRNLNTPVLMK